ncbi:MAG TPA: acetyl-CoA C-acyltransferase [Phycisphaerae bacterium]|nr:acetyl-CoA C-acyltransferase [Phycisphaerae bacterium]
MATNHSYLVAAKRSPTGRFLGGLSKLTAAAVGGQVAKALLDEVQADRAAIDEVLIGQVVQAGAGQNPARQVALAAGLPDTVSACTVNKVCGSGLQSVMFADQIIRAGDADLILAGGIESMSQAPYLARGMRAGTKFGDAQFVDGLLYDGLTNVYDGDLMGVIAEETAEKFGLTREQQDEFAVRSHQFAGRAEAAGLFKAERVPIEQRRGKEPVAVDETVREDASMDAMALLKPAFAKHGTVTAGNASSLSDGAAMVLVAGEKGLSKCQAQPLARVVASATSGVPPRELFLAPVKACKMVCEKAGWQPDDVDLWELNEAFAAQSLACLQGLELDLEKVNVHGGAIALGHPIGASGARILSTLLHAMKHRQVKRGVAALCLGGGNAVAMAVETV